MLSTDKTRFRGNKVSMSEGINRLNSAVTDTARRFKRLPFLGKIVFFSSLLFSVIFYWFIFHWMFVNDLANENFLEEQTCPACFGMKGCGILYYGGAKLSGWSKYRMLDVVNTKNVLYASLRDREVVLKKLGKESEFLKMDNYVCKDANRPEGCDVPRVFFRTNLAARVRKEPLEPNRLHNAAGMFTCASYRLMDRLWDRYKEFRKQNNILLGDKLQLWYTATLNPEPLLLQTFPASERWPFPEYLGACGRYIIVEHVGKTLEHVYDEPFHKRAGIAYELLKIADLFTNNDEDFALYMTDLSWENFGVDASGKVRVLDAENIIVVDKLAIEAKKPKGYDQFWESNPGLCTENSCLSFSPENLCSHLHTDHNYYGVCTNILSPHITDSIMPGGLLHDMPVSAKDFWDLEHLLNECARPSSFKGRMIVKEKLMTALRQLQDQSKEHLNPQENEEVLKIKLKAKEHPDVRKKH